MEFQVAFIGMPDAVKAVGGKEIRMQLEAPTLGALLKQLKKRYGPSLSHALCNKRGEVDDTVQVMLNESDFIARDMLEHKLSPGDKVTFLMMMAGG